MTDWKTEEAEALADMDSMEDARRYERLNELKNPSRITSLLTFVSRHALIRHGGKHGLSNCSRQFPL